MGQRVREHISDTVSSYNLSVAQPLNGGVANVIQSCVQLVKLMIYLENTDPIDPAEYSTDGLAAQKISHDSAPDQGDD